MDRHRNQEATVSDDRLTAQRLDTLLGVLSAESRRMVVAYLREHGTASVDELTDVVVGWSQARGNSAGGDAWEQTRTVLYHNHLPALAAADLVAYDTDAETVEIAPLSSATTELLSTVQELESALTGTED
ncbi:transcriptional regulator [Haloarcula sp. S1AR25-5A]|uniref:Transcriptional regulator n=1 Tax=Haloarcula terrestris TaxID=2950533 RepID=A0AAE4EZA4_9EURY|nr:transcriptional regulator [Haloarcula terrestris]MDS0222672.1 transcriptional regulator [Haloarcula terrestris]